MTYLADTSMVIRLRQGRDIAPRWLTRSRPGSWGCVCPWEAELMRAVTSKADRDQLQATLRALFAWHPMPDSAWRFVERTQHDLVNLGNHKGPSVVDLLIAATAQAWGLTVLHVDAGFETIATVTNLHTRRADQTA